MQIQKAIQVFLEKNNLHQTLNAFKSESKKVPTHYGQSKTAQLSNIHKFTLAHANAAQIRQHFQKTDPNVLRKAVKKLKKNCKGNSVSNPEVLNITKLKFFKKLLQKQSQPNHNQKEESNISEIDDSRVYVNPLEESRQYENQWQGNNDIGYDFYDCTLSQLEHFSEQISVQRNLKETSIKVVPFPADYYQKQSDRMTKLVENLKDKKQSRLPPKTIFEREQNQDVYPLEYGDCTYDSYNLKIVYDREKTGFEQERQMAIVINEVLAARYQVVGVLGEAAFSKVIQVFDLQTKKNYSIKIIQNSKDENTKDFFDQSIDEIKLLRFISANCNPDQWHLLGLHDFFYYKEHLMIVTELLKDNLLDVYRMYPKHFDLKTIQVYSKQILKALQKLHSLNIIHCDLKPENILVKSYSKQEIKIIDVGSSIFMHDKLRFYVQTRSYRAPQVILGCPYDEKIDIWSFGCILAELFTGEVLFESEKNIDLLVKMQGLRGPWPSWMIEKGKQANKYFTKDLVPFEQIQEQTNKNKVGRNSNQTCRLFVPKLTNLRSRINCNDDNFINFLSKCLKLDPSNRFSAKEALRHPFLNQ